MPERFDQSSDDAEQADRSATNRIGGGPTERAQSRGIENRVSMPVIIKRWDEATRHPDDVLQFAIERGAEESKRRTLSLALSAFAAGAIMTFTAMAAGAMTTYAQTLGDPVLERLLVGLVYPLGFLLVILSGSQLFTEHTALALYPVLDGKCAVKTLLRVWSAVLVANLLGCILGAALLTGADPVIGAAPGYAGLAEHLVKAEWGPMLTSAVLAGWLMALGGWLVLATPPTASQMLAIYVVTFLIGFGGLHHSIAGAAECLTAWFTGAELPALRSLLALAVVVIGNVLGGALFVGVLNYAHIRQTREAEPVDERVQQERLDLGVEEELAQRSGRRRSRDDPRDAGR